MQEFPWCENEEGISGVYWVEQISWNQHLSFWSVTVLRLPSLHATLMANFWWKIQMRLIECQRKYTDLWYWIQQHKLYPLLYKYYDVYGVDRLLITVCIMCNVPHIMNFFPFPRTSMPARHAPPFPANAQSHWTLLTSSKERLSLPITARLRVRLSTQILKWGFKYYCTASKTSPTEHPY
jgi:hypothetical protein